MDPSSSREIPQRPPRARDTNTVEDDDEFKGMARTVYEMTSEAQKFDGCGRVEEAFKAYERALQQLDKALSLPPSQQEDNISWKLRNTRKEILERVSDLQHGDGSASSSSRNFPPMEERSGDLPPAYNDIMHDTPTPTMTPSASSSTTTTTTGLGFGELAAALDEIAREEEMGGDGPGPLPLNAREVFTIPAEVQIYFISANDNVSAPSYPSFLRVVRMDVEEQAPGASTVVTSSVPAFLQVGDWTYPLIPGHSPLFRSTEGIYIFPDLTISVPGMRSYVGLILPESVTPETRRYFEQSILSLVGVQDFPPVLEHATYELQHSPQLPRGEKPPRPPAPPPRDKGKSVKGEEEAAEEEDNKDQAASGAGAEKRRFSTKIAEGLITGAEAVSRGLIAGASKATVLIDKGADYLQSKMDPVKEKPQIKPEVKKGMKTAKTVSGKAVQVSGFVVTQLGRATISLGRHMAPHVHRASTNFLRRTVASDQVDAEQKVDQVLEVTTGAVVGFGTVYFGLEHAAKALVSNLANNTVKIVEHRYGEEAGEVAKDTAGTAGNAALTALNVKNLAPKAVAKKVVKNTGKVLVKTHQEKKQAKIVVVNNNNEEEEPVNNANGSVEGLK